MSLQIHAHSPSAGRSRPTDLLRWCPDWVLVTAIAVAASGWSLAWPTTTQDEFALLIYPDLLGQGRVPNIDFFSPYGPGSYWLLQSVYWVFGGPDVVTERLVGLTYHILLALGVWRLTQGYGRSLALLAGVSAAVLAGGVQVIAYAWLLAAGLIVWGMVAQRAGRPGLAGTLCAAAVTVRPEVIVAVVTVFAAALATTTELRRYVRGFGLASVPLAAHVWLSEGALLRNVFTDRVVVNARVGLPQGAFDLWLGLGIVVASVGLLVTRSIIVRRRHTTALALLAVTLLPQALQRTDREHLIFVGVLVVPLALAETGEALRAKGTAWDKELLRRGVALMAMVLLTVTVIFSFALAPRGMLMEVNGRRLFAADSATQDGVSRMIESIEADLTSREKVLAGPQDMSRAAVTANYFYYLMPAHLPRAYFLEFAPGVTERVGSRLLQDVKTVDVLLLSEFPAAQNERLFPNVKVGTRRVNDYVDNHFCVREKIPGVGVFPGVTLMKRCGPSTPPRPEGGGPVRVRALV